MIPPITAAIKTPNAPTPPCSSAAGGVEKDEPDDLAEDGGVDDRAEVLFPELEAVEDDAAVGPGFGAPDDPADVFAAPACADAPAPDVPAPDVFEAEVDVADPVAPAAPLPAVDEPVDDGVPAAPGFAAVVRGLSCLLSAGFLSDEAGLPVLGIPDDVEEDGVDDGEPAPELPGFSFTFSALRSIVTGRFAPAPEAVDGLSVLPGLSAEPDPLPPDEDAPPEDLLSVAICSPPEPSGHTIHT
ncbi:MAG: hypothetical protein AAFY05_17635 [Pseudomonadota bacterium]